MLYYCKTVKLNYVPKLLMGTSFTLIKESSKIKEDKKN